ncbi:MAG: hypothetical protein JWN00_393 [Actinomycetia bacterium]|nr:hypothetical protein [Actinomycetes bacterium]
MVVVQALGLEGSGAGTAQRQGAEHRDVTGDVVTGKRCGQVDLEQGLDVRCVGGAEQPGRGGEHAPLDVGHGLVKQDAGPQRQVRGGVAGVQQWHREHQQPVHGPPLTGDQPAAGRRDRGERVVHLLTGYELVHELEGAPVRCRGEDTEHLRRRARRTGLVRLGDVPADRVGITDVRPPRHHRDVAVVPQGRPAPPQGDRCQPLILEDAADQVRPGGVPRPDGRQPGDGSHAAGAGRGRARRGGRQGHDRGGRGSAGQCSSQHGHLPLSPVVTRGCREHIERPAGGEGQDVAKIAFGSIR